MPKTHSFVRALRLQSRTQPTAAAGRSTAAGLNREYIVRALPSRSLEIKRKIISPAARHTFYRRAFYPVGASIAVFLACGALQMDLIGATVVEFNPASPANSGSEASEPASLLGAGVTSGSITRGAGLGTTTTANSFSANSFDGTTTTSSTTTTEYFSFQLQLTSTYDFTSLSIATSTSNTGPGTIGLFSSADGFATQIGSSIMQSGTTTVQTVVDLSSLANLTGSVEFRIIEIGNIDAVPPGATAAAGRLSLLNNTAAGVIRFEGTLIPPAGDNIYFDVNGMGTGSGVTDTSYSVSGAFFNSDADGITATPGTFTSGSTPTFSAGTDAADNTYTIVIDSGSIIANGINFQEGNVTLAAGAGTLTLQGIAGSIVNVEAGATAIVSEPILGMVGLNKTGAGSLTLTGGNGFTGNVTAGGGILSVNADGNFGNASNDIILNNGTLVTTADISLNAGRDLSGTGSLAPVAGTTLTFSGAVNTGALAIADSGTVALPAAAGTKTVTGLTFSSPGTVNVTGVALSLLGNVATTQSTGTATISGAGGVNLGSGTRTYTIADGSAATDLLVSANLSGAAVLFKVGDGTLELTGDNSGLTGTGMTPASLRIGASAVSPTNPTNGGTVGFTTATSLGAGQVQFNGGTLRNDAAGPLVVTNSLSIGARDAATTPGGAILSGSDTEFQGNGTGFFGNFEHTVTVNNATTLSGTVSVSGGAASTVIVAGPGTLVLSGPAANTFTEAVTIAGTATLNAAKTGALGANASVTVNSGGTLLLGTAAVATTDRINNGAAINLAGGTFDLNGNSEIGTGAPSAATNGVGTLTLTMTSTLDFGAPGEGDSVIQFLAIGGAMSLSDNFVFQITNYSPVSEHLYFGGMPSDFTSRFAQNEVTFNGLSGYNISSFTDFYEVTPIPEPGTIFGALALLGLAGYRERQNGAAVRRASRTTAV